MSASEKDDGRAGEPCCYAQDRGLPFHSLECTDGYVCSRCKAPIVFDADGAWRFNGETYEHKCPDADPQSGHFPCVHVDDLAAVNGSAP